MDILEDMGMSKLSPKVFSKVNDSFNHNNSYLTFPQALNTMLDLLFFKGTVWLDFNDILHVGPSLSLSLSLSSCLKVGLELKM